MTNNTNKDRKGILTITLNPALDMTGNLENLKPGAVNLVQDSTLHPAGKGVNVAKVLSDLGSAVAVTGFLGDSNDQSFIELFESLNAADHFVRVPGSTRINVKLVESCGDVTDLNFPGVTVSAEKQQAFETKLLELAADYDLIVIAGSLPVGITPKDLSRCVAMLGEQGKQVIVDTSRAAFQEVLSASPWLVKPNEDELSEWAGRELKTEQELREVGEQLAASGVTHVVISRGADGVLWLNDGQWLKSQPPRMKVVSTVGAGDTLVAGLCYGLNQGFDKSKTLAFATALSALAVTQTGVGATDHQQIQNIVEQVQVSDVTVMEASTAA